MCLDCAIRAAPCVTHSSSFQLQFGGDWPVRAGEATPEEPLILVAIEERSDKGSIPVLLGDLPQQLRLILCRLSIEEAAIRELDEFVAPAIYESIPRFLESAPELLAGKELNERGPEIESG